MQTFFFWCFSFSNTRDIKSITVFWLHFQHVDLDCGTITYILTHFKTISPTCQDTAPIITVDKRQKNTSRSEMRQKCRMPLDAMTCSRLRLLDRWTRQAFWQSFSLVWKPQTVMTKMMWQMDQKRPKRRKPGITRYHCCRWLSCGKKTCDFNTCTYLYIYLNLNKY